MKQETISYQEGEQALKGQYLFDETLTGDQPLIIVFPAFEGLTEVYIDYAKKAVQQGYRAFVADVYGDDEDNFDNETMPSPLCAARFKVAYVLCAHTLPNPI